MTSDNGKEWDPFVRFGHWALAVAVVVAYASGDELEEVHLFAGYTMFGIVLFRSIWGFVGTPTARFGNFLRPWRSVREHLQAVARLAPPAYTGHNPAGGWMVVILLATLALTALTGMAVSATGLQPEVAEWLEELHEWLGNFTLVLVAIHVGGVLVESFLTGENLPKAMLTGRKRRREGEFNMNKSKFGLRSVFAIALAAATTFALTGLPNGGLAYDDDREQAAALVKRGDIRPLDDILAQALAMRPGRVLEAELQSKQARHYYEVEVLDADGVMWELKFDASSGKLIEHERED